VSLLAGVVKRHSQCDKNSGEQVLVRPLGEAGERVAGDHGNRVGKRMICHRGHAASGHVLGLGREFSQPVKRGDDCRSPQPPGEWGEGSQPPEEPIQLLAREREPLLISRL
jgi:hypothetical protein